MEYLRTDHRAGPSTDTRNTSARALQRLACVLTLALTCACAGPDTQGDWSIGIYRGDSPLTLGPPSDVVNPVLRARDITDVQAQYVADPFMLRAGPLWYLFFEVLQRSPRLGLIGLATSRNARIWTYERIVLRESFHLSYPYVFEWQGAYYMIPESHESSSVRLYIASEFPYAWRYERTLLSGEFADASLLRHADTWWLFALEETDTLRLYFASELTDDWVEHPRSPLIRGDRNTARPGGRMILFEGRPLRFAQDDDPTYGNALRAFAIDRLTPTEYQEHAMTANPILRESGHGWNATGMHHVDPHEIEAGDWIACVDGRGSADTP